jgi:hypothetical protein
VKGADRQAAVIFRLGKPDCEFRFSHLPIRPGQRSGKHHASILLRNGRIDFHAFGLCSLHDRHRNADGILHRVQDGLAMQLSGDLVSQDLRECLYHLGEIVGGTIETDEVLGNIFKHFCVGK